MPKNLTVFSPLNGTAVPLEQVPDPVFSEHMLGDGIAVLPENEELCAPFDAKIVNFNKALHALVLAKDEVEVLIHVGLETVSLNGEGFTALAKEGDEVKAGQPLLKFNKEIILKKAASPLVMLVATAPADVPVISKANGPIQTGQPLFTVTPAGAAAQEKSSQNFTESLPITVVNPNGLHARPAAVLSRLAASYPHAVQIRKGDITADAKSVVGIMGLALGFRDQVTLLVAGPQEEAREILTKLQAAFADGFGEKGAVAATTPQPPAAYEEEFSTPIDFSKPVTLKGLCAGGGLAQGKAFQLQPELPPFEENASDSQAETAALDNALKTLNDRLETRIAEEKEESAREILTAHLSLLQDPMLAGPARETIQQGKTAAFAFNEAVRKSVDVLKKTNNPFLMERIADLKDLRREILSILSGREAQALQIPAGSIVTADELLPSDVPALPQDVAGVLLAHGSPTAHAGILLRNRGIPSVVRAGNAVLNIENGTDILLDADNACATVNPSAEQKEIFSVQAEKIKQENIQAAAQAHEKALTQDGVQVFVEGNVSGAEEAASAQEHGADGMGLVRTEFLFQERPAAPSEEEQAAAYQAVMDASKGKTVTFRTLDAGGDKPLPFVDIAPEENPIVGVRGIRAFKRNENFFRTQIRALLRVKPLSSVRIMLPMVSFAEEVDFFKQVIAEEKAALGITDTVQLGIMVEVPSAALTSRQMAERADFFSLGTNDLTQYTLAIDRGHKELSAQADCLHPAVLKLIDLTCRGAQMYNRPVAVCGAMAGDLTAVPLLIGLGVRELAVGPDLVARVKALVRRLDTKACAQAAADALELDNAEAVRELVKAYFTI